MEIRQLEYFVAVAEEESFTRAAGRLYVAQSGVSAQIRQLERELGQPLFERTSRTVRLTQVGATVLPHARAALASIAAVQMTVDQLAGLLRGRLTIGTITSISPMTIDLPDLLAGFHAEYPAVELTLTENNTNALLEDLRAGVLDLAFVGLTDSPPPGVDTVEIASEPLVAAVHRSDPLAAQANLESIMFKGRALITLPRGTGMRAQLDTAFEKAGFTGQIASEANDPRMLAELAAKGLGIAILPKSVVDAHGGDLLGIALADPQLRCRIGIAWATDLSSSPATAALIAHLRTALEQGPIAHGV